MKNLLAQIAKFGVVGVLCFFIDFGLYTISNVIFRATGFAAAFTYYYLIAGLIGFSVSMIVNYLLSMKYVFERRDNLKKKKKDNYIHKQYDSFWKIQDWILNNYPNDVIFHEIKNGS